MESSSSKRRRLMLSYVPSWPDLPATFESLNDDTLTTVLEFVGKKSYRSFGGLNKRCKEVYLNTKGMTKETFIFGYAPLSVIIDRYDSNPFRARNALCKGVVFYNRRDVLALVIQRRDTFSSKGICEIAAEEGRTDILEEMWNKVTDGDRKRYIFIYVDVYAARGGKMNVLELHETKGLSINKSRCAGEAAHYGHLHIIQWLREEKGLELYAGLYNKAINGGHLHLMKWLREQGCPWSEYTFPYAARKRNLDILQWLHDEGCPWPEDIDDDRVSESLLKPEVLEWLRTNGYGNRIEYR